MAEEELWTTLVRFHRDVVKPDMDALRDELRTALLSLSQSSDGRKQLVHGIDLRGMKIELLSARQDGSHLFLRYRCR